MKQTATVLKSYFETGDFPNQTQFGSFIESYTNLVDNNLLDGFEPDLIPVEPSNKATATPIIKKTNALLSWNLPNGACLLPDALQGSSVVITNVALQDVNIYAAGTDVIYGLLTTNYMTIKKNTTVVFYCLTDGTYQSFTNANETNPLQLVGSETFITDVTPPVYGTAYQLTKQFSQINTDHAVIGAVIAPPCYPGQMAFISSNGTYGSYIFPYTGNAFRGSAGTAAIFIGPLESIILYCVQDTYWQVLSNSNTTVNNLLGNYDNNVSDVTPSAQGTATLLKAYANNLQTTNVVKGATKLPSCILNTNIVVINNSLNNSDVYPSTGDLINNQAINLPITLKPSDVVRFVCTRNGKWELEYITPSYSTTVVSEPADPATTASGTGVMMGLAMSFSPLKTGKMLLLFTGDTDNTSANDGTLIQIRVGTGAAPANGAALTGTTYGRLIRSNNNTALAGGWNIFPVSSHRYNTFTVGTTYWMDISLATVGGGTARVRDIEISAIELSSFN